MKKIIITLILVSTFGYTQAQTICFTYDNAGNRVSRQTCYTSLTVNDDVLEAIKLPSDVVQEEEIQLKEKEIHDISEMLVFPNPTSGYFTIKMDPIPTQAELYIYDNHGKMVMQRAFGDGSFDVSSLAAGNYVLLINDEGRISSSKIIKE